MTQEQPSSQTAEDRGQTPISQTKSISVPDMPIPDLPDAEHRCAAIPWEVRGKHVFTAFFKTVFLVTVHPRSLGLLLDQPVNTKEARGFRKMVMLFCLAGVLAVGGGGVMLRLIPEFTQPTFEKVFFPGLIGGIVLMLLAWLLIRFTIGAARWFYCPPALSPAQRETSLALSYYLTAPLSLASLAWLTLLILLGGQGYYTLTLWTLLSLGGAVVLIYYVFTLAGLRTIARRRGWNLFFSALGLEFIWITIWGGMLSLPVTIGMWLMLFLT